MCLIPGASAESADRLYRGESYALTVEPGANSLTIALPGGEPLIKASPLVGITFADGQRINSSDMTAQPNPDDPLRIRFTHPRAELVLRLSTKDDRLEFRGEVASKQGAIIHVALPHSFLLDGNPRTRFLFPTVLGVELSQAFLASDGRQTCDYPPAFCDFAAAELGGTPVYLYRCEGAERPRPSVLLVRGGDPPVFRHYYVTYVREGDTWTLPAFACQVGGDFKETLLRYKRECGLGRPLREKMSPEFLAKWAGMAEALLAPPFADAERVVEALPMPAIIRPHGWMLGGFDRKYPDFLPPNPQYLGEGGFRSLIRAAHDHGHLVRPYVNFTWWCTGWDGPGSEPAPSYVKYGDVALSRDIRGELIHESYSGNYGYCACPAHPIAVQRRLAVRDALLDDYGVDFLYEDQLGARRWHLDLNPALDNPADYGWALMKVGNEDASRCPVETECGHDQALAFASGLNYWMLPPLSPVNWPPGRPPRLLPEGHARSFPYGLFLSSGDAVINIPDCAEPDRLAWAMLLGGRVALGRVGLGVSIGPERERALFLQTLAKELAGRVIGDPLVSFEYLAPRVARSTFERHHVVANFSADPWPLPDGTKVAPDGFDLQAADGFRAGRYVASDGKPVLAILSPSGAPAATLAAGAFEVSVGTRTLHADAPRVQHTVTGRLAVLDFGPGLVPRADDPMGADALATAFAALDPVRIRTPVELRHGLASYRVVVNPYRQHLVSAELSEWPSALARFREWCEAGGVLVELGGWPLWFATAPEGGGWARRRIGPSGLEGLCGERCQMLDMAAGASELRLTGLGRQVLSRETQEALERQPALVTRPPLTLDNSIVLCDSDRGAYLVVHPTGYGAVVRVAGVPTEAAPKALAETVTAILDGRLELETPAWRTVMCRPVEAIAGR
jgi:hypothetical protein